ncbi:hypothetical protein PAPYR_1067 [Paratrimastix pyriformis]|uniref:ATP-binding protein n=1 Tax=Paratrimastix pyriformis TaxID=342808 RepID=A0ABQ8UTG8_9EUKA|nr:hypothetical protein PAPYR_1067 [Paratrimastix pyriformis]
MPTVPLPPSSQGPLPLERGRQKVGYYLRPCRNDQGEIECNYLAIINELVDMYKGNEELTQMPAGYVKLPCRFQFFTRAFRAGQRLLQAGLEAIRGRQASPAPASRQPLLLLCDEFGPMEAHNDGFLKGPFGELWWDFLRGELARPTPGCLILMVVRQRLLAHFFQLLGYAPETSERAPQVIWMAGSTPASLAKTLVALALATS